MTEYYFFSLTRQARNPKHTHTMDNTLCSFSWHSCEDNMHSSYPSHIKSQLSVLVLPHVHPCLSVMSGGVVGVTWSIKGRITPAVMPWADTGDACDVNIHKASDDTSCCEPSLARGAVQWWVTACVTACPQWLTSYVCVNRAMKKSLGWQQARHVSYNCTYIRHEHS